MLRQFSPVPVLFSSCFSYFPKLTFHFIDEFIRKCVLPHTMFGIKFPTT